MLRLLSIRGLEGVNELTGTNHYMSVVAGHSHVKHVMSLEQSFVFALCAGQFVNKAKAAATYIPRVITHQ